jgi:hypothetical protein
MIFDFFLDIYNKTKIMKKIKLNILSSTNEYNNLINEIREILINNETEFIINLLRVENRTPVKTLIEIEVEYPIIGKKLINLCNEFNNLKFEKNIKWENSHIMNKIVIIGS